MEKRTGWGTEYNGEWEYAVFGADGKFNNKANCKACFQCHKPHDRIDYVISYPATAGRTMVASAAGRLQLQLRAAPQHEGHGAGLEVTAAIPLTLPSPPSGARDRETLCPLGRGQGEGPGPA